MSPPSSSRSGSNEGTSHFDSTNPYLSTQILGPEFYGRSKFSCKVGLVGVGLAALIGAFCVICGALLRVSKARILTGGVETSLHRSTQKEILSLLVNLVVAACTEATGFVHGIALRSKLASDKQLEFNTNIRMLSASKGWFTPNGTLWSVAMTLLLLVSYYSTPFIFRMRSVGYGDGTIEYVCVHDIPLIVLGVALLLQALITLTCVWASRANILTWSSSPFDLTAALVHSAQITPKLGRCMHSVGDSAPPGPVRPSRKQPSAWRAHPGVRRVTILLWLLVAALFIWGLIMMHFAGKKEYHVFQSWSSFQTSHPAVVLYYVSLEHGGVEQIFWACCYIAVAVMQTPLTLGLHCSELLVNVIRYEQAWKKASAKGGAMISSNPLISVFWNPMNLFLISMKPLLHWMLGLAFAVDERDSGSGPFEPTKITVSAWPSLILIIAAVFMVLTILLTIVVFRLPKGPQPAAFGHIQTLANLMDEFPSSKMWWGDKGGEPTRHAGTSNHPLPEVVMGTLYA